MSRKPTDIVIENCFIVKGDAEPIYIGGEVTGSFSNNHVAAAKGGYVQRWLRRPRLRWTHRFARRVNLLRALWEWSRWTS